MQHGSPGHTLFLQQCHDIQEKGEEKPTVGGAGAPSPPPRDSRHHACQHRVEMCRHRWSGRHAAVLPEPGACSRTTGSLLATQARGVGTQGPALGTSTFAAVTPPGCVVNLPPACEDPAQPALRQGQTWAQAPYCEPHAGCWTTDTARPVDRTWQDLRQPVSALPAIKHSLWGYPASQSTRTVTAASSITAPNQKQPAGPQQGGPMNADAVR